MGHGLRGSRIVLGCLWDVARLGQRRISVRVMRLDVMYWECEAHRRNVGISNMGGCVGKFKAEGGSLNRPGMAAGITKRTRHVPHSTPVQRVPRFSPELSQPAILLHATHTAVMVDSHDTTQ